MLADVVDEQCSNSATVVGGGDSTVSFLAGGIPDLGFNGFGVDLNAARGKFDADGRLGIEIEFVASEAREEVGLSYTGVSDQDHCGKWLVRARVGGVARVEGTFEEELEANVSSRVRGLKSSGWAALTSYSSFAMVAGRHLFWSGKCDLLGCRE
jgi:hypothetical protein